MTSKTDIATVLNTGNRSSIGRRFLRWAMAGLLILIAAVAVGFWLKPGQSRTGPRYATREIIRGDLTVTVSATGNLAPTGQVDVGSELSGIVSRVDVDYNDRVRKGQPLAYLDDTRFAAAVRGSKASLESARARVAQAQATTKQKRQNLDRLRHADTLSGGKALSPSDLDTAEAELERAVADETAARAAIQQAEANLELDETHLAKTVILSPVNGTVLARSVDPGQTVAASLQAPVLFTLAEDLTRMELQVDVDEADVGQVREGQNATFTVDAWPDRSFHAQITQVRFGATQATAANVGVVTYKTLLTVDNIDLALRPGMTATADIVVQKIENALLAPNAALRFSPPVEDRSSNGGLVGMLLPRPPSRMMRQGQGKPAEKGSRRSQVWVLKHGSPSPVEVTTGPTDGVHTVITDGDLKPGDMVITEMITEKK